MASEKAALEFQLEKSIKQFHEVQMEAERSRVARRSASAWEEDADIKALEPLPLHHRHMATANQQLQKAAKLLDSGAVRATRFLWRHPVARVSLLFYLVFVHLFLMYLMHRLQVSYVILLFAFVCFVYLHAWVMSSCILFIFMLGSCLHRTFFNISLTHKVLSPE
jgi:hypothetical protein